MSAKPGAQKTQQLTKSAFLTISYQPDWQINNGSLQKQIMVHTQILLSASTVVANMRT